ncbi:oligosaccharide flippase family protein [Clostridium sp. MT-14]|uniref:Polysaccharide biosynthesis protein n=1 Tax=Clostridium aromativorans TaxID=2836848 RepID=A0ABS8N9K7_9CLOT|nr:MULTISPECIES: polysaccharide biosynthesis protein [Clostridium]KAA8672697.1 polysaccharide biosynthesis protein [Clostridium sp. HV4-5-A1G]MCC9296507.1 polysaccharide biosynthesis protein [Clostridium aromativorans]CAB1245504.1 Stage V sporulation protein B [Clostridiaceae bacterium BL-3]
MKEQSTTKGFAILSAAGMLVKILSIIYIPLFMRIVGDEGYGLYGASYQIYTFVYVLTNSGIPVAISKLISELNAVGNYRDAVKGFKIARFMLMAMGIVMAALLMIFASPLSRVMKYSKIYLSLLSLAPAILFTSVASAYRGYFQGSGNMTPTAVSQVIEQIVNTIFGIAFAAYLIKYGVEVGCVGAPIGTSLGALASACFLMFCYENSRRSGMYKKMTVQKSERIDTGKLVKRIIKYGVPITICVGMTYAGNLVDMWNTKSRLMAGGFSDVNSTILYGYLTKYQQLLNVPITIISSLSAAILPAISAAVAIKNGKKVKDNINYSFRLCFLIAIPCAFGFSVLSDPIFQMLKFRGGSYIMAWGSVVLVLMSLMQIQTTILQSIGKLFTATLYSIIGICVKIITNYFLISIPEINILGAVIGSTMGFIIPIALNHRIIKKSLNVRVSMLNHAVKPLAASAAMGIIVYVSYFLMHFVLKFIKIPYLPNAISTVLSIAIGIVTYMYVLVLIGGISKRDLQSLPSRAIKLVPRFILTKMR